MNFGEALNDTIRRKGITKKRFAEMIGATQSAVTKYTQNKVVPRDSLIIKMESVLDVKDERLQKIVRKDREIKKSLAERKEIARSDTETKILSAWKRGERTPYEVSQITGYSLRIVAKYLPVGGYE